MLHLQLIFLYIFQLQHLFTPTFVYNLPNTIRSTVFNFNKVTSEVNIGEFLAGPSFVPYNCESKGSTTNKK